MVDTSPRRIWLGLTIPGKKMAKLLAEVGLLQSPSELLELYREEPHLLLGEVGVAVGAIPEHGAFGPALRKLVDPSLDPDAQLYGAILTDIRDFLRLRFRATREVSGLDSDTILRSLETGATPPGVDPTQLDTVINYTIAALDVLTRKRGEPPDISSALAKLALLLAQTSEPGMLNER